MLRRAMLLNVVTCSLAALRFAPSAATACSTTTRRELFSSVSVSAGAVVFSTRCSPAWAYGIQARPARDFSGTPADDEAVAAKAAFFEAEARQRLSEAEVKKAQATSARFGGVQDPPANKAQEKLAKARTEEQARAQRR